MRLDLMRYHYIDTAPQSSLSQSSRLQPSSDARSGGSQPVILCVHGNPTWSFYYREIAKQFQADYRVLAVDHIGCGLSDKPSPYPYTLETHTRNLIRFVEGLDLRQIVLVVHDWGGAIGLGAAVELVDRIAGLVILNTAAFPPPYIPLRISACRFPVLGSWSIRYLNSFARAAISMAIDRLDQLSPAAAAGLLAPYDSPRNRVAIDGFVRDIPMQKSHPTYAALEQLELNLERLKDIPTRLVWGMKDWCFRPECLYRLQENLPQAITTELLDVGHYVMEEAADEVIAEIKSLIAQDVLARPVSSDL
jgi:haloalkane dehalogenase